MSEISMLPLAVTVLVWFALAFVTGSWTRQWLAAAVAGIAVAWWRYGAMKAMAATLEIAPMPVFRFAAISVAGMLVLASAGMGLRLLLGQIRRTG